MTKQYTFHFDSNSCSGCKTCQTACKDKHNLQDGSVLRNVFEVTGGGWKKTGEAWVPDVFTYYLSLSCSHCEDPICAEVCPAKALIKRDDGIVLLDIQKCLGCGYCGWVCPYNALQYNQNSGHMTKCTFCADEIDQGKPPVCVAACPMRALDFGSKDEMELRHGRTQVYAPMPDAELTNPSLVLKQHNSSHNNQKRHSKIWPEKQAGLQEWSLVAFTLISQLAVGAIFILGWLNVFLLNEFGEFANKVNKIAYPIIGVILAGSMMVSLFHLGTPQNFYRAILNNKTSWLSREVISAILFMGLLILTGASYWIEKFMFLRSPILNGLLIVFGFIFIYSMSRIYMMRTVPAWNTISTMISFFLTTLSLGTILPMTSLLFGNFTQQGTIGLLSWLLIILLSLLVIEVILNLYQKRVIFKEFDIESITGFDKKKYNLLSAIRTLSTLTAAALIITFFLISENHLNELSADLIISLIAIFVILEEITGRYLFYKSYYRRGV